MPGEVRWNWRLVAGVTAIGVAAVLMGVALQAWERGAWGGVLVEVGAGLGLVAAIVYLERRVLHQVSERAESVARETAERTTQETTADIRDRLARLEELDRTQEKQRQAHDEQAKRIVDRVRADVSFETVRDLLRQAREDNYFAPDFRVRGSSDPYCHILYLELDDYSIAAEASGDRIYLSFEPRYLPDAPGHFGQELSDTQTVHWVEGESIELASSKLVALLIRLNLPLDAFDLAYAMGRLVTSFDVVRSARSAPRESSRRLGGELEFLINDGWALTTFGLEAIEEDAAFSVTRAGWVGTHMVRASVRVPQDWPTDPGLGEAIAWLRDREDFEVEGQD